MTSLLSLLSISLFVVSTSSSLSPSLFHTQNQTYSKQQTTYSPAGSSASSPAPGPDWGEILRLLSEYVTPLGNNVSEECKAASNHYLQQIAGANVNALKMLDASAKISPLKTLPGMLMNPPKLIVHHPGTFDSCLEVVSEDLTGQHCLLTYYWGINPKKEVVQLHQHPLNKFPTEQHLMLGGPIDPMVLGGILGGGMLKLGRCVPSECHPQDVATGLQNFMRDELGEFMDYFVPVVLNCHTADEEISMESRDWVFVGVIAIFSFLLIVGTFVDIVFNIFQLDLFPPMVVSLTQGFSLYTNTLKLFHCPDPSTSPDSLHCINGIRFISMTWVLIGHGYSNFMGQIFVNDLMPVYDPKGSFMGNGAFTVVTNALPSVDTFFLIGATLLCYLTLKELDKTSGGGLKFWVMFFVHRYIRLTGVYAIILGFHATLLKFFATGVQSGNVMGTTHFCQKNWWANFLYVNNLKWVAGEEAMYCMGQTWYMANDMQFFILSPFVIYALWRSKKLGLGLLGSLLIIFTFIPTLLGASNDWGLSPVFPAGGNQEGDYMMEFYVVPWCRAQPYLVGLGLGYLLHQMRNKPQLGLHSIAVTWIWLIAALVGCLVIYGVAGYQKHPEWVAHTETRALYGGLHRLAWALAVSWVILACVKGAGGPVNSILSWPAWLPLARMSYVIYLIHLTVMMIVDSYPSYKVNITQALCIYYMIYHLCFCIAIAFAICVMFEAPIVHLERLLYYVLGLAKLPTTKRVKAE